jgi:peptidoglycan/xylan/chitin deacetylase (PgdA/CDA1 family)
LAGLKSDQFVITGFIGAKGYVTKDEVVDMERRGHEIGAHTRTHPYLSKLSSTDQRTEIGGSKLDLEILLDHPIKHFAYPYGDYNDTTLRVVREVGFESARTINWGNNFIETNPYFFSIVKDVTPRTTAADVQRWIEAAAKSPRSVWVILLFHRFDEGDNPISVSSTTFQGIVDYLVRQKVKVVTHTEALQALGLR